MSKLVLRKGRGELEDERVFTAIALCDSREAAVEALKEQGLDTTVGMVGHLERTHSERILERKRELAPRLEGELNVALLDESRKATALIALALEKGMKDLEAGKIQDTARFAREWSQVRTQGIDKKLALEGRPTAIVEKRDYADVIRQLEAMKVVKQIEVEQGETV